MPLFRRNSKQCRPDQIAVRHLVLQLHWFNFSHLALGPVHKIIGLVRLWLVLSVAIDVGQQRTGNAVAHVCNVFAKRLQLVVGQPFGELAATDLKLGLPDRLAQLFG